MIAEVDAGRSVDAQAQSQLLGPRPADQPRLLEFRRDPLRLSTATPIRISRPSRRASTTCARSSIPAAGRPPTTCRRCATAASSRRRSRPACPRASPAWCSTPAGRSSPTSACARRSGCCSTSNGSTTISSSTATSARRATSKAPNCRRAAGRRTRASARCSRRFPDAVRADVMDGTWQPPVTDGSGRDRDTLKRALALLKAAGYDARRHRAARARDAAAVHLRAPGHHQGPGAARARLRARSQARRHRGHACAWSMPCNTTGGDITYDFDMIEYRWDQSLSPGNEQAFYWGSAAADARGHAQLHGRQEPGDRRHDRGAAARRASATNSSPRCARSIAC